MAKDARDCRATVAGFVVGLLMLGAGRPDAVADSSANEQRARARTHVDAAIVYFDGADYAGALRELEEAYRLDQVTEIQYNLALCHEKLGQIGPAIVAFRAYLAAKPDASDRPAVEARIADLEARVAHGERREPDKEVIFKTVVIYRAPPPPPGRGARVAAWSAAALAVGALAGGVATAVLASHEVSIVNGGGNAAAPPAYDGAPRAAAAAARTDWIASGTTFGLAGLLGAGSAALFMFARKIDREAPRVTLAPSFTPGGVALLACGHF